MVLQEVAIERQIVGGLIVTYLMGALILRSRRPSIPVWSIMAFASFITIGGGLVHIDDIGHLIDLNVILFLIGMFTIVALAEESGLLTAVAYFFASRIHSRRSLFYVAALMFGLLAALATNDTVALMGPPIAYILARIAGINYKAMLLLLAFSLTIGSVMTPIGNPQNILVAVKSGLNAPFLSFVAKLAIPTLLNLVVTAEVLMRVFRVSNKRISVVLIPSEAIRNRRDAIIAGATLALTIVALVVNDVFELLGLPYVSNRGFIPFIAAAGICILASNPRRVLSRVDWGTIIFFMAMFIVMDGVWGSGVLQPLLKHIHPSKGSEVEGILQIMVSSIILSQFLSNVPFVNLYISYMKALGYTGSSTDEWLSLACYSTVAGNLTILGAASNIIILEVLESRYSVTISFVEFMKIGALVTLINVAIYLPFLLV